jgi:hypothetical protein
MIACTFCGSEDIRPSGSSALDAPVKRVVRALTFRRLYRCRSCDALFEAPSGAVKRSESAAGSQLTNQPKSPASIDSSAQPVKIAGGR